MSIVKSKTNAFSVIKLAVFNNTIRCLSVNSIVLYNYSRYIHYTHNILYSLLCTNYSYCVAHQPASPRLSLKPRKKSTRKQKY